jgi:molybdate transport system substrate-binding protein
MMKLTSKCFEIVQIMFLGSRQRLRGARPILSPENQGKRIASEGKWGNVGTQSKGNTAIQSKSLRLICFAALLAAFIVPQAHASATEILVLSPGFVYNSGLLDLAAAFTKETGIKVTVKLEIMNQIVNDTKTGMPAADVVVLPIEPFDLMGSLALDKGIQESTFTPLGRVEIGLAVKAGAPHPDISTVEKLVAVLKGAKAVMYSNPAKGSMEGGIVDRLLKQPQFSGVHGVISSNGEGGQALARGEGDMALQLICEVYPHPEISLVGPLPSELNAYIDGAVAVSSRSADAADAEAFIRYITRPEATATWKAKGLDRF